MHLRQVARPIDIVVLPNPLWRQHKMSRIIHCIKLEKDLEGLDFPLFRRAWKEDLGECIEGGLE